MDTQYAKKEEVKLQKNLVDSYRQRYSTPHGQIYQNFWNKILLSDLPTQRNLTVLDLGCGSGILLKELTWM